MDAKTTSIGKASSVRPGELASFVVDNTPIAVANVGHASDLMQFLARVKGHSSERIGIESLPFLRLERIKTRTVVLQ